ncbi:MAG: cyclic nucleotide-binding domain-containing protein, partial [Thermoplasmata archaeon]|nr:cyclic nucleotide-binding domain-containing protein [Thermoplasmata archaeon]NIY04420.1 cyclic nucleotide-binding domain-containing protein [Thermoplasmata archaeon]
MVPSQLLQKFELFQGLTEEGLEEVAAICREENHEAGTILFREGDTARDLFVVVEGEVALEMGVELWTGAMPQPMRMEVATGGEVIGWSALVGPHILTRTARCLRQSKLIAVPGDELRRLLDRHPRIGHQVFDRIAQLIGSRLWDTRNKLTEFLRKEELAQGYTPEEATLIQRVQYLIDFRWIAAAGIVALALFANLALGIEFSLLAVLLIALGVALYNFGFLLASSRVLRRAGPSLIPRTRRFIQLQSFIDLVAFTALLQLTGGIENPFIFYYIFHVILASVLLPYRSAYLITTVAAVLVTALAGLEYFGIVTHVRLEGFIPVEIYSQGPVVLGVLFALITSLYVSTYIATSIAGELRKRQREVATLKDRCFLDMKELEEANRRLVELDRLRTHFLAMASHDLKAPLAAVQSYLQVILGDYVGPLGDRQREMLSRSSIRIKELLNLINDLLDATRIERGQIVREMNWVELRPVVENVVEGFRSLAAEKGLQLELQLPQELPQVKASARRLEQVLDNLLNNAIQFTPSGGKVQLSIEDLEEQLRITVRDTGVGISSEDLPRVFEEFYRGRSAETKGAGLGLAIVNKIVEAHG